jgi:hypothetical protein
MKRRAFLVGLPLLAAAACVRDNTLTVKNPDDGGGTGPTPVQVHVIEFRATGTDPGTMEISQTSSQEGTTTVRTTLPFFTSLKTTRTSMFLALTARDIGFFVGTVTVQIFVDNVLFREASVSGFNPTASISGQWSA